MKEKRGQVWIETVIYTLIALIMIGTVLSVIRPKIEEIQDKAIIDQTISIMEAIDEEINSVIERGSGNKKIIEIELQKGEIQIDGQNSGDTMDTITYILDDTRSEYSEQCTEDCGKEDAISHGNIKILTIKKGKLNTVKLILDYSESGKNINLQNDGTDILKTITKSTAPYKFEISNEGVASIGGETIINIALS